jgi:hypothetical protein
MKKDKLLIVVPYADFFPEQKRKKQLRDFVAHFSNQKNIIILISEQASPEKYFNRGQIINAGIKWFAENVQKPKYIILHDVDMLPDKKLISEYSSTTEPTSFVPFDEDYKKIYFEKRLDAGGGIFGISFADYIKINGYPNNFWNWGGEDNAFNNRLMANNIKWHHINSGKVKHTDLQRKSHKSKMNYLRENKLRSMMTSENIRADLNGWKRNGISQTSSRLIESQTAGNTHHVLFRLSEKNLKETLKHNEKVYKEIRSGGGDSTILILIPYGDLHPKQGRSKELKLAIDHFTEILKKHKSKAYEVKVMVCEQVLPKKYFNKGQLLNLGLKWYCDRNASPSYLIFSDMDMLPDDTLFAEYIKFALAGHMAALVPVDEDFRRVYGKEWIPNICNGVFGISYKDFITVNGFPNSLWLWDGEDEVISYRIKRAKIWYHLVEKGKMRHTDTIRTDNTHKNDYLRKNKLVNYKSYSIIRHDKDNWQKDGYANMTYSNFKEKKLNEYINAVELELNEYRLDETLEYNTIKRTDKPTKKK